MNKTKIITSIISIIYLWIFLCPYSLFAQSPPKDKTNPVENIWTESLDDGIAMAKTNKKPVFIYFFTNSCGVCKGMEKEVFSSPEIKKRLTDGWIPVKINCGLNEKYCKYDGKKMNYTELASYFRIHAVPTFVFFGKNGKPIQKIIGGFEKEEFGMVLDYMNKGIYNKGIKFKDYKKSLKSK